jgi:chaperonin cofactor prefoldin
MSSENKIKEENEVYAELGKISYQIKLYSSMLEQLYEQESTLIKQINTLSQQQDQNNGSTNKQ